MEYPHIPVMPAETMDALDVRPGDVVLDATAGMGGHSALILERLGENGRLICFDEDPEAISVLNGRFGSDPRVTVVNTNFSRVKTALGEMGVARVDRVLADLGVSSLQLDTPERGFSYVHDGPLLMSFDRNGKRTAGELINTLPKQELIRILRDYGEERFAPQIAAVIIRARERKPLETTGELAEIVKTAIPQKSRRTGGNPCKRTFQAFRIATTGELDVLPGALKDFFDVTSKGGRVAVITFHSLEDRIVKYYFRELTVSCTCPPESPVCVCGTVQKARLLFSSRTASPAEQLSNPRSKSARLRAVEKLV
ncbi:MAG: 16S rRNA (cytosine(1402)-N(4))-methyltransferase RsmH [Clostridia bacterium]|nr:16S rRNA (cytosine(1402)-N(4))-methyltransferase RsmH [Clostridia bacterium]